MTDTYRIIHGDALHALAELEGGSVDSIVTDPPYLIDFMGKGWDSADGIAGKPEVWRECLRVLKPGGHLLAFGATRTYHRMTVAIEDAGFEIRDSIHWTYGSGFPKSLNVSKAIDKQGAPEAQQWEGWGTALKPSHEPIVVARKPLEGTVAQNVLAYGTGALNIDGTRVGTDGGCKDAGPTGGNDKSVTAFGDGLNGRGYVPVQGLGRWPANTVLTHAAGCQATGETVTDKFSVVSGLRDYEQDSNFGNRKQVFQEQATTSTPVYRCVPGCPVAELDQQSGISKSQQRTGTRSGKSSERYGAFTGQNNVEMGHTDAGGASRFFTTTEWDPQLDDIAPFLYVAKPSKKERNAGLDDGNKHPTVKPVALMRHLIRLVTPPGGTVLDPFTGSGTTGVAAIYEGAQFIGIEMTDEYLPIIEARLTHAHQTVQATPPTLPLENK